MRPIQILPETIAHKIAAGEVVERPVSVVKELVENAIDAGATCLELEFARAGIDSIQITDNGHGIPAAQLGIALKRHATSKIVSAEDLFRLSTLGFRGEALPSIASVSDFTLASATDESVPVGYVKQVKQSVESGLSEVAMPRGTRVTVENLFCTTPARLKFLKQPQTEWSHIADYLTAMALGYLDIEWKVFHNGKKFLHCLPTTNPRERIFDLFGRETQESLYPFARQVSDVRLDGLLGHPNFCAKSNRNLFVYVNGRYVQDRLINHAIVDGYRSLLMKQQYPMVVLQMRIDPELVDVNVHPAKRELRFSNGNAIHHLISETIHQSLEAAPWAVQNLEPVAVNDAFGRATEAIAYSPNLAETVRREYFAPLPRPDFSQAPEPTFWKPAQVGVETSPPKMQAKIGTVPFEELQVIGQFLRTYVVCEYEGGLFLVDQHAAHERIGFEKLKEELQRGPLASQVLLHPIPFELTLAEASRLSECVDDLATYGFDIAQFGDQSFVIKSHPVILKNGDWLPLLRELLDPLSTVAKTLDDKIDHILATMACHRQIRAKDKLEKEEMRALLQGLKNTPRSYHCPHGRPVMVEIAASEIERWFKRVL